MALRDPEQRRAYNVAYYAAHREEILAREAAYYAAHREEKLARDVAYNATHRAERRAYYADYYAAHGEEKLASMATDYAAHPEKKRARAAEWRAAHPNERRAYHRNRRALLCGAPGRHSAADIAAQYARQHGLCFWRDVNPSCAVTLENGYHTDHVIPLSRGGPNGPENLVLACPACNLSKGAKTPEAWAGRLC
jgi:5-methylcytosine-specific restriction endonuclease McrA